MSAPRQIWWNAAEIAASGLPDLPGTRQGIEKLLKAKDWRGHPEFARRRKGKGGGWEYSWQLFPLAARKRLLAEAPEPDVLEPAPAQTRDEVWAWFEAQKEPVKVKARERLAVIDAVEAFEANGTTRYLAVIEVARVMKPSSRTIWNWFAMIEGVERHDRLAYLAPRHKAAVRSNTSTEIDLRFFDELKGFYLRIAGQPFAECYRRCCEIAKAKGWGIVPERTARRRMNERVPRVTQVFAREGFAGLQRCFPPQKRDRSDMVALEGVNADCHKIDVFVRWGKDKKGKDIILRPQIIAFQDLFSGKVLSWRVDWTPNKVAVMAAFGDMIEEYGIPQHCLFDNGREFANKWMTAGAKTRFRFKVRDDDPLGVLSQLGIKMHWATPGHGQAKPIERAFGDFASDIAKDPRFHGAYVGHKPDAKPENYGSRSIELADFIRVVEEGIIRHNAREGRRSHTAKGRSFDTTFAVSYAEAPIRKATEEQRRLWLMGQEVRKLNRDHGRLSMFDNTYWSDWMNEYAGQRVVARFDPGNLHAGVYIYATDGAYLGFAACEVSAGFFDLASARATKAEEARRRREYRKMLADVRPVSVQEVAAHLDELAPQDAERVEANIVRPEFGTRPQKPAPVPVATTAPNVAAEVRQEALIAEFKAPTAPETQANTEEEDRYTRFRRALDLEAAIAAQDWVGEAEQQWLDGYQTQPEYGSMRKMYDGFGEAIFAR